MGKKSDNNWLEDIKTLIGQTPPVLFEALEKIADENSERGNYARETEREILKCIKVCKTALGEIRASAGNFTLHDLQHSINVIDLMGQLLDPSQLSAIEIVCLIYTALLHDIGMVKLGDEETPLEEIRESHGDRSAYFIENDKIRDEAGQPLNFGRYHLIFHQYLPTICASHMKDISYIERLPADLRADGMNLNTALCAILLRLADAMDLSRNRAPYTLYNFLMLRGISQEHWKKHLSITDCRIDEKGFYRVDGICDDEAAHRALFNHLDMIEKELRDAIAWTSRSNGPELKVKNDIVKREIRTQGDYQIWHHTFTMDFASISELFMGEHLYGDRTVGLREIIQNAIDACMVRKEREQKKKDAFDPYIPCITVSADDKYVYIRDNGIGMTDDVIRNFFLNIGVSYYRSREYRKLNLAYKPMGFFGIGFLAGFMLSDEIWVRTSGFEDQMEYRLHLVKGDRYITKYEYAQKQFSGTEIKLKRDFWDSLDATLALPFTINTKEAMMDHVLLVVRTYVKNNFWKLTLSDQETNSLRYKITEQNYEEYLAENKEKSDYQIVLSRYLYDIEGCVYFYENDSYRQLWNQSGVKYNSIFDALEAGRIEIGGRIAKSIPFANKGIRIDGYKNNEIKNVDQIPNNCVWCLIPEKNHQRTNECLSLYNMTDEIQAILESSLYENVWKSAFISRKKLKRLRRYKCADVGYYNMSFEMYYITKGISDDDYAKKWINLLAGKKHQPSSVYFLVKRDLIETAPYESTFHIEKTVLRPISDFWFRSVRINAGPMDIEWLMFENFRFYVNIKNSSISPQASRQNLTESSNRDIAEAMQVVKYLWFIEQLESRNCPEVSINYLKNRLRQIWKKDNPLVRTEFREKYL